MIYSVSRTSDIQPYSVIPAKTLCRLYVRIARRDVDGWTHAYSLPCHASRLPLFVVTNRHFHRSVTGVERTLCQWPVK